MSTLQEMLSVNGGSFAKAQEMALKMIASGHHDVWLDLALLLHSQGKIEEMRDCHREYEHHFPGCPRNRFCTAWLKLHDGDLLGGLSGIEAGRVLHSLPTKLNSWEWDGEAPLKDKTVLLFSEGGFGDQIMTVRAVNWLKEAGAKVLVACSPTLIKLFNRLPGVAAVMSHDFPIVAGVTDVRAVHHDYHIRSMSAARLFKRKWENLWTAPYIFPKKDEMWERIIPKGPLNIGLRWKGNPQFEHEQLRLFPPEMLFNAIKGCNTKFWSFQKDDTTTRLPDWVTDLEPFLSDWDQTAAAISQMDLMITSDTATGHLFGAMGKKAWIIVPAMPYWPWARPGPKSSWYPTATLYRQEFFGNWERPFDEIEWDLKQQYPEHFAPKMASITKPTITVCSLFTREIESFAKITNPVRQLYATKHGYKYLCCDHKLDDRPPSWSKLLLLQQMTTEWGFWNDADALITNLDIKLESLIDDKYDLIFTRDGNGLNAGNFLVKNSEWSKKFLQEAYQQAQFTNHCWWEQAAIRFLLDTKYGYDRVKVVCQRAMNSYPCNFQEGDFVLHVARIHKNREEIIKNNIPWGQITSEQQSGLKTKLGMSSNPQTVGEITCRSDLPIFLKNAGLKRICEVGVDDGVNFKNLLLSGPIEAVAVDL